MTTYDIATLDWPDITPWTVVGVLPLATDYPDPSEIPASEAFAYTVGVLPSELYCSCRSIEGHWVDVKGLALILNVLTHNLGTGRIAPGDDVLVTLGDDVDDKVTQVQRGVWWIGTPQRADDRHPARLRERDTIIPLLWSSSRGFTEGEHTP